MTLTKVQPFDHTLQTVQNLTFRYDDGFRNYISHIENFAGRGYPGGLGAILVAWVGYHGGMGGVSWLYGWGIQ